MIARIFALIVLVGVCAVAYAAPTSQPGPSTQPTTAASANRPEKFPSPRELLAKLKEQKAQTDRNAKVAYIDLGRPLVEKAPAFSLFGSQQMLTLHNLIARLHQARDDQSLSAVLLTLGANLNLAQAQEIRDALDELRQAKKRVFVYADGYDTANYVAASGATDVCMLGGGEIMIPGVGLEAMFFKTLLDKIGVRADYVQIGEYKGADEEFTRTGASPELRGEFNKILDTLYGELVDSIAAHRHLSKEAVTAIIDQCILTGPEARDRKLVDHLVDVDGLRDLLKTELGKDINLVRDYGGVARDKVDLTSPFGFFSLFARKTEAPSRDAVALIHLQGVIIDGSAEQSLFGGSDSVGSDDLRRAFHLAERDDNIKAIVLRIDSPGGSALASEAMWQAARRAAKKPLIVSVGSMAASGGYYVASAGDYIFADPAAIIGSIGVVGGKFVATGLFDKVGITTESFTRGANAGLFSMNTTFSDHQREMVTDWMTQTYDQFKKRVMTYRGTKIKDIDQVAKGRIFVAPQAKELGMIDALGGIEDAIAYAAKEAEMQPGEYDVVVVPGPKTLADLFSGGSDGIESRMPAGPHVSAAVDELLGSVAPPLRGMVTRQLHMLQLLQQRPVLLAAPFDVVVH